MTQNGARAVQRRPKASPANAAYVVQSIARTANRTFESRRIRTGFRTLATNGVDKPVLNVFRMAGLMRGDRVKVESPAAVPLDSMLKDGVRGSPNLDALAVRSDREVSIMTWNYHDDDVPDPMASLRLRGVPAVAKRILLRHYRIDQAGSNAYAVWKDMGSPQNPTPEQYARLESAGQLQLLESARWISEDGGKVELSFTLGSQAVSLVQLSW
jgi:xylan 1,4-beta-xylosidase